jgi:hypothetical protein
MRPNNSGRLPNASLLALLVVDMLLTRSHSGFRDRGLQQIIAVQQIICDHSENNPELTFAMAAMESYSAAAVGFSERLIEGSRAK